MNRKRTCLYRVAVDDCVHTVAYNAFEKHGVIFTVIISIRHRMYVRSTVSWSLEGRTYMSTKRIPSRTRHDRGSTEGVFRSAPVSYTHLTLPTIYSV